MTNEGKRERKRQMEEQRIKGRGDDGGKEGRDDGWMDMRHKRTDRVTVSLSSLIFHAGLPVSVLNSFPIINLENQDLLASLCHCTCVWVCVHVCVLESGDESGGSLTPKSATSNLRWGHCYWRQSRCASCF